MVCQALPHQTWVLAALGEALSRPARSQQLVVGGLSGLRGYDAEQVTGHRLWRLNLEDRILLVRAAWNLASVGAAAFVDAARGQGPGAGDARWRTSAGFGLRLSFPHQGVSRVARLDLAWPVAARAGEPSGPAFSFGSRQAF